MSTYYQIVMMKNKNLAHLRFWIVLYAISWNKRCKDVKLFSECPFICTCHIWHVEMTYRLMGRSYILLISLQLYRFHSFHLKWQGLLHNLQRKVVVVVWLVWLCTNSCRLHDMTDSRLEERGREEEAEILSEKLFFLKT